MERREGSETSENHNLTPGKYPKEHVQYSKHGESLKSRTFRLVKFANVSIMPMGGNGITYKKKRKKKLHKKKGPKFSISYEPVTSTQQERRVTSFFLPRLLLLLLPSLPQMFEFSIPRPRATLQLANKFYCRTPNARSQQHANYRRDFLITKTN
jgi:hypothetical protein